MSVCGGSKRCRCRDRRCRAKLQFGALCQVSVPSLATKLFDPPRTAERLAMPQREIVGRDALIRSEKSAAPSAASAASLIRERRRSSSNGSVVLIRPE
jgi:hypothetical protein